MTDTATRDESPEVVPTMRVPEGTWSRFLAACGTLRGSSVLRRLLVLYTTDAELRDRVDSTPDPRPDRRYS